MSNVALTWAWGQNVSDPSAKLLLIKLADQANDDGVCWPSKRTLMAHVGLTRRPLMGKLRLLEEAGLLITEPRFRENGSHSSNLYRLPLGPDAAPPPAAASPTLGLEAAPLEPSLEPSENLETEPNGSVSPEKSIRDIYDHWRERRHKTNRRYETISDNRRKKIQTRLTEFSVEDLKLAIDCVALDPWSERSLHDDLMVIFRNREQVEKFLAFSEPSVVPEKPERAPPRRYGYGVTAHEMFERAKATAAREEGQRNGAEASGGVGGAADRGLPPGGN